MDESTRRRSAAFELRQRAADDLDEAARLDGLPALRLLDEHVDAIAQELGFERRDPDRGCAADLARKGGTVSGYVVRDRRLRGPISPTFATREEAARWRGLNYKASQIIKRVPAAR